MTTPELASATGIEHDRIVLLDDGKVGPTGAETAAILAALGMTTWPRPPLQDLIGPL